MTQTLGLESPRAKLQPPVDPKSRWVARAPSACAAVTSLVALAVLAGWLVPVYPLVTVLPNLPAMAQSTAATFLISSASLWLQRREGASAGSARLAGVLALAVFLIGAAALLRYVFPLSGDAAFLSHFLHPGPAPRDAMPQGALLGDAKHPVNRMSPNSALNFMLLGAALYSTDLYSTDRRGRNQQWPSQVLCLIVVLAALAAIIGQIYGVTFLYGLSPFLGMALHTAILFLVLSSGLLLARPDRGFMAVVLSEDAAGRAAARFLPLALAVPVVLGGVSVLTQRVHSPNVPFFAYLLVVASIGLLGWLVWGNILALSAQVLRAQSYQRQVAEFEREQVEDALLNTEQRLVFAVEGAGIGIWHWDIAADSLIWSEQCKAMFGLPPEAQMTRSHFYERIHPEDRPLAEATIAAALNTGSTYDIEYRVVWPEGTVHWLASKGRGYHNAQGQPVRFEGTVQGIDERKATEAALRDAAERQKTLLRDVLASVTGGRLRLAETEGELPPGLPDTSAKVLLTATEGLRELRQAVQAAALPLDFPDARTQDMVTAASEGGMNAITHGGGQGEALVSTDGVGTVQVRVQDWGTGINMESLPKAALSRGWSSTASLGHGLVMILQSVDRLWLLTGEGGTTIVMEQDSREPPPSWL